MSRLISLLVFALAASACGNDLDVSPEDNATRVPPPPGVGQAPRGAPPALANGLPVDEDDSAPDDDSADDDSASDDSAPDDDDSGASDPVPAGPPAEAEQRCSVWTECGPHFADPNSGFDCLDGTCTCDAEGTWDDACARIGGVWSDEECFCFVGADPMPPQDANSVVADDEDPNDVDEDRQCWWVWRETCEPDRWVDTSGYEYVCDGPSSEDCGYEYVEDGYWESGDCDGFWIRRCDDGTEKRFG